MKSAERTVETKLIVLTGGPGAGKTAVLEMAKKIMDKKNSIILPEAASIIFGGGFMRLPSLSAKAAAQRAIYHVQSEMETLVIEENKWRVVLCDRGTLDGLAYWPLEEVNFWDMSHSTIDRELNKYYAVIHLHSPTDQLGYNHDNPLRIETALQAHEIDKRIAKAWKKHPRYYSIMSTESFLVKAQTALDIIKKIEKE